MSLKVENIKRLIGLGPNAKANESARSVNSENLDSDIPGKVKGENKDTKIPKSSRRMSTRILFVDIFSLLPIP